MAETFTCDNCGKDFPTDDMKEAKAGESNEMLKLCPTCLDEKMNQSSDVYGIEGDEKRRAAYLAEDSGDRPAEPVTGKRE
jgi:NAD-dependent SIR2 family protein deacetylase